MTANLIFLICSVATKQWSKTDTLEILSPKTHHYLCIKDGAFPVVLRISWLLVTRFQPIAQLSPPDPAHFSLDDTPGYSPVV